MANVTINFQAFVDALKQSAPQLAPVAQQALNMLAAMTPGELDALRVLATSNPDAAQAEILSKLTDEQLLAQMDADLKTGEADGAANADRVAAQKEMAKKAAGIAVSILATLITVAL